jgi:hypothetical protein
MQLLFQEIKDWPGYLIYSDGRVWSKKTNKFLRPQPNAKGYLQVCLSNGSVKKYVAIHRLVATAFVVNDNIDEKTEVNHIDENIINNDASNLEWITPNENLHYGTRIKRIGLTNGKRIKQYTKEGNLVGIYPSCAEAARITGLNRQAINNCALGKSKHSGGYVWKWEDDE